MKLFQFLLSTFLTWLSIFTSFHVSFVHIWICCMSRTSCSTRFLCAFVSCIYYFASLFNLIIFIGRSSRTSNRQMLRSLGIEKKTRSPRQSAVFARSCGELTRSWDDWEPAQSRFADWRKWASWMLTICSKTSFLPSSLPSSKERSGTGLDHQPDVGGRSRRNLRRLQLLNVVQGRTGIFAHIFGSRRWDAFNAYYIAPHWSPAS